MTDFLCCEPPAFGLLRGLKNRLTTKVMKEHKGKNGPDQQSQWLGGQEVFLCVAS